MKKSNRELLTKFCEFAKLQDNSDAEYPNITTSVDLFIEGSNLKTDLSDLNWDPLDDSTFVSPEFLFYILIAAKEFFEK